MSTHCPHNYAFRIHSMCVAHQPFTVMELTFKLAFREEAVVPNNPCAFCKNLPNVAIDTPSTAARGSTSLAKMPRALREKQMICLDDAK